MHGNLRAGIKIDKSTIDTFNGDNVHIMYVVDSSGPYLAVQYKNGTTEGPLVKVTSSKNNTQYQYQNVSSALNDKEFLYFFDQATVNEVYSDRWSWNNGTIIELTSDKIQNKELIFALNSNGTDASVSETRLSASYENETGETIVLDSEEDDAITNYWETDEQEIVIDRNNTVRVSDGKLRYYFKVREEGTYKVSVSNYGYGQIEQPIQIMFVDKDRGLIAASGYGSESATSNEFAQNNYVLSPEDSHYIDFDEFYFKNGENVTLTHKYLHSGTNNRGNERPSSNIEDNTFFEMIERTVSDFILSIARVVNWLIGVVVGRQITLDDIIFNQFSEIRMDFFKTDIFGNAVESESSLVMDLREPVTTMYNFFKGLAIIGYLIILIYIGLKIMLSSTTAKKKATYKETFMYWVTGIMILFFMPYYMKYAIALDEAIVTYISDDSGMRSIKSRNASEDALQMNSDANHGFFRTDFENVLDYENSTSQDYMSSIGHIAAYYQKLGYSIAFLVLTWQVVTMLIYYYKRIFVTALLIMIFPLIAFTYVWDKLNDGRSQALSAWTREYTITVFVQVFHAIVYVFITNTIYATIQRGATGEAVNADFILLIIASSFMFAGEDILKKLFGGGGEALGSATQSAAKIAMITKGTVGMGTRVIKNTVGKDGFVRKTARSFQEARTYGFLSGVPIIGRNAEASGGNSNLSRMEMIANDQERHRGVGAYLPSEGEITPTINEAAEMLYDLNNGNTPREIADALNRYHELMNARNGVGLRTMTDYERRQFDEMMKRSGISAAQIDRLDRAMENAAVATAAISGDRFSSENRAKMQRISQNLRIEIEAIFPASDSEGNALTGRDNVVANRMMNVALISMTEHGVQHVTQLRNFENEWNAKVEKAKQISDATGFKEIASIDIKGSLDRRNDAARNIVSEYTRLHPDMSATEEEKVRNLAKHVASLKQTYQNDATKYQVAKAFEAIEQSDESKEIARVMMEIAGIDSDIDNLKYLLTKKINVAAGARQGVESGTLFNTSRNRQIDDFISARRDEIFNQYRSTVGRMSVAEEREAKYFALHLARIENYDAGLVESSVLRNSVSTLGGNQDLANRMIQASGMEGSYESYQTEINNLTNVEEWAANTVNEMETRASSRRDEDPYVSIVDIIEAAKNGTLPGESTDIGSTRDMFQKATRDGAHDEILDRKRDEYNRRERIRAQALNDTAIDFGYFALDSEGYNKNPANASREEAKLDGYTLDEMKTLARENAKSGITSAAQMVTDVLLTPVTTMAGMAINAAMTDDFMPLEEAMQGAILGNKFSEGAINTVETLTAEKQRQEKLAKIKKEANDRVKGDESSRLEARKAFEDAAYEARDGLDGTLVFTGANATMHLEADGRISATVNIMAENAAFVHVSEDAPIPSGGWQAYQESIYYQFDDRSPSTPHTLYIYVRDRSGNIQGKKIDGIHL